MNNIVKIKYKKPLLELCNADKTPQKVLTDRTRLSAYNIVLSEKINETSQLSFSVPFDNTKISLNDCEKLIKLNNEYYIIKEIQVNDSNTRTMDVVCVHESTELKGIICEPIDIIGATVREMFDAIITSATSMQLGYSFLGTDISDTTKRALQEENERSVFENLVDMAKVFSASLEFSLDSYGNKQIYIRKNPIDRGKYVKKSSGLKQLNIRYDTQELFTKLSAFGYTDSDGIELTIHNVNPTKKSYVENYDYFLAKGLTLDEIKRTPRCCQEMIFRDGNIVDENDLYRIACEELSKCSVPVLNGDIDMVDISIFEGNTFLAPMINEKLIVIDKDINFSISATIVGIERNYDNPLLTKINISNVIKYNSVFKDLVHSGAKIDKITTTNPTTGKPSLIGSVIQGKIDGAVASFGSMLDSIDAPHADLAILFEDRRVGSETYGACAIGTRGLLISNVLNPDGTWQWSTAINGAGIYGNEIVGHTLYADKIYGGMLKSINEKTWINMENGTFNFGDKVKFDGDTFVIDLSGQDIDVSDKIQDAIDEAMGDSLKDFNDLINTDILTPSEKIKLREEWMKIQNSYRLNLELANIFAIINEKEQYTLAYTRLRDTIPNMLLTENMDKPTNIDGVQLSIDLVNFYNREAELLKAINVDINNDNREQFDRIAEISSDGYLTPSEKLTLTKDFDSITKEYGQYITSANGLSISTTAYTTAYNSLNTYLTPLLAKPQETTFIDPAIFKKKFSDYHTSESNLLKLIDEAIKKKAEDAQDMAEQAKKDAEEAIGELNKMGSDGWITKTEKLALTDKANEIKKDFLALTSQARVYEVSTSNYANRYYKLMEYLYGNGDLYNKCDYNKNGIVDNTDSSSLTNKFGSTNESDLALYDLNYDGVIDSSDLAILSSLIGTPKNTGVLTDLQTDTEIIRTDYQKVFTDYYTEKQLLLEAITKNSQDYVDSEISIAKDEIRLGVKSDVKDLIVNQKLKNLLYDTEFPKAISSSSSEKQWRYHGTSNTLTIQEDNGVASGKVVKIPYQRGIVQNLDPNLFEVGKVYTVSMLIKHTNSNSFQVMIRNSSAVIMQSWTDSQPNPLSTYTTWFKNFTYDSNMKDIVFWVNGGSSTQITYLGCVQIEKGSTRTPWEERFDLNTVTREQSQAYITITKEAIEQNVSKTYATQKSVQDVDGKFVNYTDTQTMEGKITASANGVLTTVSDTYLRQDTANQTFASKSYVDQTATDWTAKFTTSGGTNLLRNSAFKNGTEKWWTQSYNNPTGSMELLDGSAEWAFPSQQVNTLQIRMANQTGKEFGIAQKIDTVVGEYYTVSFYYACHRGSRANFIVRKSDGGWLSSKSWNPAIERRLNAQGQWYDFATIGGKTNVSNWGFFTHTFQATEQQHNINIVFNDAQDNGHMWIVKPIINIGKVSQPYNWHPSEIYEGATKIDADGIEISHSNINSRTRLKANGLEIIDKFGDVVANLSAKATETELKVDKVWANNVKNIYDGNANLYVNHDSTTSGIGTEASPFSSFNGLIDHFENRGKILNKNVVVNVISTGTVYENISLKDFSGDGALTINFNSASTFRSDFTLVGNTCKISLKGGGSPATSLNNTGAIILGAGTTNTISATNCTSVYIEGFRVNGKRTGGYPNFLRSDYSKVCISNCDISNYQSHVASLMLSNVLVSNVIGSTLDYCGLSYEGSTLGFSGKTPKATNPVIANYGGFYTGHNLATTASSFLTPPAPTTAVMYGTFYSSDYGYWTKGANGINVDSWNPNGQKVYQGSWGYGNNQGYYTFNDTSIRSWLANGTVLDGSTITLKRLSAGNSTATSIYLRGSTTTTLGSGTPNYQTTSWNLGTLLIDQSKTFTLPKAFVDGLKTGAIKSACFFTSDGSNYTRLDTSCKIVLKARKPV